ncbi:LysR family transcriptional regulator [Rahnella sp. PCH160]|uniref:LysR family transcriptional regulator n=1 Tax=Rahnella sp. PCH160 TaxID=3447928 RepID=UPI0039FDBB0D
MKNYKIDDLMSFVEVGRTGSFRTAAIKLERDASVISRRVSQLEKSLGVRLLIRTTRAVTLTEAGQMYYHRLRRALEEVDNATRDVGDFTATPQGSLKVSVPTSFGREIIARLFAKVITDYPKIQIDAHFEDRIVDIVGEGFDVVIRVGILSDSSLISRKLGSFRSALVATPTLIEKFGLPRHPEELAQYPCLGFTKLPEWPNWTLEKGETTSTLQPNCVLLADSSEAVLISALQGLGIALVPEWMAAPYFKSSELINVLPGWRSCRDIEVHALMPGSLIPAKTRIFIDELIQSFKISGF